MTKSGLRARKKRLAKSPALTKRQIEKFRLGLLRLRREYEIVDCGEVFKYDKALSDIRVIASWADR